MNISTVFKMIGATLLWGIAYTLGKYAVECVSLASFLFAKSLLFSLTLWIMYWFSRGRKIGKQKINTRQLLLLFGIGLIFTLYCVADWSVLKYLNPGFGAFYADTAIALASIGAGMVFFKERLGIVGLLAVAAAVIGLVGLSFNEFAVIGLNISSLKGMAWGTIGALLYTFFNVAGKKAMNDFSPILVLAVACSVCALLSLPFFLRHSGSAELLRAPGNFWLNIIFVSVMSGALAYKWWMEGLQKIELSKLAVVALLIPVFGLAASIAIYGERANTLKIACACLIVFSVWLATKEGSAPKKQKYKIEKMVRRNENV